ncbi:MAG: hypothetical protein LIO80_02855 [Lachnospiraceae bacterium]|nr:hypothetical protein [Lachnospiraceae bacterium]
MEWVRRIAHELRHLWQYKYHPEYNENYIHGDTDKDGYLNQISELDAEAFAEKLVYLITGEDFIDSYTDCDESVKEKVKERMNAIEINHENIRNLKGLLGFIDDDM